MSIDYGPSSTRDVDDSYTVYVSNTTSPFVLVTPVADKEFVLTGIILKCRAPTGFSFVYLSQEDNATDMTTSGDDLLYFEAMQLDEKTVITPINILVSEGQYLTAHADLQSATYVSVLGHYRDV